jgi:hypothetical protein
MLHRGPVQILGQHCVRRTTATCIQWGGRLRKDGFVIEIIIRVLSHGSLVEITEVVERVGEGRS